MQNSAMGNWAFVHSALLFSLIGGTAAQAECPKEAIQTLFNVRAAVAAGQAKDANQVYQYATLAETQCADNSAAMALAAELFMAVSASVQDPKDKQTVLVKAYDAIITNGRVHDNYAPTPEVYVDNKPRKLYTYGQASTILEHIVPQLAKLHRFGTKHEIFSMNYEGTACPHESGSRITSEAISLKRWAGKSREPGFVAIHRLQGLWDACTAYRPAAHSHALAHLYMAQADVLKIAEPQLAKDNARLARQYADENRKIRSSLARPYDWDALDNSKLKEIERALGLIE